MFLQIDNLFLNNLSTQWKLFNTHHMNDCCADRWDIPSRELKGAHGSQSDNSRYPYAVVFTSPLTSRLCSQLQELQELPVAVWHVNS